MGVRERHRTERNSGEMDDDYHGRVWVGMWATRQSSLTLCFFFSRGSQMVLTQCDFCAVLRMSKWWEIQNKRGQTTGETVTLIMVATSALTALLFHLPSLLLPVCGVFCVVLFCVVFCCAVLCCAELWCAVLLDEWWGCVVCVVVSCVWSWTASSGNANDWVNRERDVLDVFSNLYTRWRFEWAHEVFQRVTHRTHTHTTPQHTTTTRPQHHTETETEREREKETTHTTHHTPHRTHTTTPHTQPRTATTTTTTTHGDRDRERQRKRDKRRQDQREEKTRQKER